MTKALAGVLHPRLHPRAIRTRPVRNDWLVRPPEVIKVELPASANHARPAAGHSECRRMYFTLLNHKTSVKITL